VRLNLSGALGHYEFLLEALIRHSRIAVITALAYAGLCVGDIRNLSPLVAVYIFLYFKLKIVT